MTDLTLPLRDPATEPDQRLVDSVRDLVDHPSFPCVGAKATFHQRQATVRAYDRLASPEVTGGLAADLASFVADTEPEQLFVSFVAVFRGPRIRDERHFERLLWRQLSALSQEDRKPWNETVSADPHDAHFAFSFASVPLFVVGLHPKASRDARRAGSPVLVFNPHGQFERLKQEQRFERMRDVIRRRDAQLQGTINPMVRDFGTSSEARQYSGRVVQPDWEPPTIPGDRS